MQHAMLSRATTEPLIWVTMKTRTCPMGMYLATAPWTDQVGLAIYLVLEWHAKNTVERRLTNRENDQYAAQTQNEFLVFLHK